jgi:hypothetical protein
MGVFLGGRTPEVERFLREFARPFPPSLTEHLLRLCDPPPDHDVLPWVHRDLDEKRKLLSDSPDAIRVIDERRIEVTGDYDVLQAARESSDNHTAIYEAVGDYVIAQCRGDDRLFELHEALYHIATDSFLADSIMATMLKTGVDLSHFFEIHDRGADYVLDADRIVVHIGQ